MNQTTERPLFRTRSGVLVEARGGLQERDSKQKVGCYRWPTGGYHGMLKVAELTPQNGAAQELAAQAVLQ